MFLKHPRSCAPSNFQGRLGGLCHFQTHVPVPSPLFLACQVGELKRGRDSFRVLSTPRQLRPHNFGKAKDALSMRDAEVIAFPFLSDTPGRARRKEGACSYLWPTAKRKEMRPPIHGETTKRMFKHKPEAVCLPTKSRGPCTRCLTRQRTMCPLLIFSNPL